MLRVTDAIEPWGSEAKQSPVLGAGVAICVPCMLRSRSRKGLRRETDQRWETVRCEREGEGEGGP